MSRYRSVVLTLLVLAAWGSGASALTSDEVLVVANANVPGSLVVAAYYAQQRQIDPAQVVAVKTTGDYLISREKYESQILHPLRALLLRSGLAAKIRCVALVWGIPVRIHAPWNPVGELLTAEATKAHYRLAVDYKLLSTVVRKFPPPRTDDLVPLANLFESPAPPPPEPLPNWTSLLKDTDVLLDLKLQELRAVKDDPNRTIATRQLMALHLEIHGLEGLIQFVRQTALPDTPSPEAIQGRPNDAQTKLGQLRAQPAGVDNTKDILAVLQEIGGVAMVGAYCREHKPSSDVLSAADASLDSELSLLWWDGYPLDRQMPNPLFWRVRSFQPSTGTEQGHPPVLLTARIDGPTKIDAMRIIRDSVQTEKVGLAGRFYIDSGGPERAKHYDDVLKDLYRFVSTHTSIPTVLDDSAAVFLPDTCPKAALYVGWYSLQKYVPAFQWVPGAVGWHVASFEAMHLRDPSSPEWCPQMIRHGVAATMGSVEEPTLQAFPLPTEFFPLLLTGRYTVAECFWRTVPTVSWRVTLIADPLYNPFKVNPQISPEILPPALLPPPDWPPAWTGPPVVSTAPTPVTTSTGPATTTAATSP
jgi:uncharacterized protein (TIGR03790 family)